MSGRRKLDRLRAATADAVARHRRGRRQLDRRAGRLPSPGELYVLPQTRDFPLEWLVIEHDPASGEVLFVAADAQPFLGAGDVAVGDDEGGPLTLRCRFRVRLPRAALEHGAPTGVVAATVVERARVVMDAVVAGDGDDEDPEYREWIDDVVAPAAAALRGLRPQPGATDGVE